MTAEQSKRVNTHKKTLPPLTLVLGPAGSGKTGLVLTRFLRHEGRPLLLTPSTTQAESLAAALAARSGKPKAEIRPAVTTFRGLMNTFLQTEDESGFQLITRDVQSLTLRQIVQNSVQSSDFFGRMRAAPGFVAALAERLREWKLAGLTPDTLEQGAETAATCLYEPMFVRKTRELAALFRAYEKFLRDNRLRDEEDGLRLAAANAVTQGTLPQAFDLLLVDGFYRFHPAQRALLAALAGRRAASGEPEIEALITLPHDGERPLLFAAPERTRQALHSSFAVSEITLPPGVCARPERLATLERRLYAPLSTAPAGAPEKRSTTAPHPLLPDPLLLFDAPNPYVEAEMVARAFRRLYETGRYAWSDFAIILRTMGDYAPILSAVFERYAIPLGVDGPETLAENPLLKTLLHLLAVVRNGWQRDDVLAFLKSSYTAPDTLAVDAFRRRARQAGVREGREQWLALIRDEETEAHSVAATLHEMAHFDTHWLENDALPTEFAEGIKESIARFGLEERIALGEPNRQARDKAALERGLNLLFALSHVSGLVGRERMRFAEFHDLLQTAWERETSLPAGEGDHDQVRVMEPYDSRERPLKVAAVMGLTERKFPRRVMEDPFLRDDERRALQQASGLELEAQQDRADDERLFFYLAVTAPSERLILSYPRSSADSDTLPSFYLDEARAALGQGMEDADALPTVSRTLADVAPRLEEVVSESDTLLAACADLFDPGAESVPGGQAQRRDAALQRMRLCLENKTQHETVRAVLTSRHLPRLPRLEDAALRADFAGSEARVFSVSELETMNRCPFQYLLRHTLKLRLEEDGAGQRAQGTLLHSVLRRYFRWKAKKPEAPPADAETMRNDLQSILTRSLERRALDASPHQLRMTQRLLNDALNRFVEREKRFTAQFGMTPAHFELTFGTEAGGGALIEDEERDDERFEGTDGARPAIYDPASCREPLRLLTQDGGAPVAICGTIDRVDYDATGERALVLDYKLGKPPDYGAMQSGGSLQMPLYLLAVERLFQKKGAAACYDSMVERGRRRVFRTEHFKLQAFAPILPLEAPDSVKPLSREEFARMTQTAERQAVRAARAIAAGHVEASPGDHCRTCAYGDVCRTTRAGGHDGEFLPMTEWVGAVTNPLPET